MFDKHYYVYILTNKGHSVLYTGVTNDLVRRVYEHKEKVNPKSFSCRYNADQLVYYEQYDSIEEAINREKQIKAGSRARKILLINGMNPDWFDLYTLLVN